MNKTPSDTTPKNPIPLFDQVVHRRAHLRRDENPHGSLEYREALNRELQAPTLICASCELSVPRVRLSEFVEFQVSRADESSRAELRRMYAETPEASVFALDHINGDHFDYSNDNLRLVCSLCHATAHGSIGGLQLSGSLILCAQVDQLMLIHAWRWATLIGQDRDGELAARARAQMNALSSMGKEAMLTASGRNRVQQGGPPVPPVPGTQIPVSTSKKTESSQSPVPPSVVHLRHFLATCSPENFELFPRILPDLRYLPSEPDHREFIDFLLWWPEAFLVGERQL